MTLVLRILKDNITIYIVHKYINGMGFIVPRLIIVYSIRKKNMAVGTLVQPFFIY